MTVGELKALLAGLPEDMEIMMEDPNEPCTWDIVRVIRGRWTNDVFVQDDDNGTDVLLTPGNNKE